MNKFCLSCGMPLTGKEGEDYRDNFCKFCSDEKGDLLPRELVQKGIAEWLKMLTPDNSSSDYMKRAEFYINAMPAWTEV